MGAGAFYRRRRLGVFRGGDQGADSGKQLFPGRFVLHDRGQVFQFLDGNGLGHGRNGLDLLGLCEDGSRQKKHDEKAEQAAQSRPK